MSLMFEICSEFALILWEVQSSERNEWDIAINRAFSANSLNHCKFTAAFTHWIRFNVVK